MATLTGVIDVSVAVELHRRAMEVAESGKDVVIELGAAERLDASALQVLLALRRDLTRRGRCFSIAGLGPEIHGYMERAGVYGDLSADSQHAAGSPRS